MYFKVLLVQSFICITICSLNNSETKTFWNYSGVKGNEINGSRDEQQDGVKYMDFHNVNKTMLRVKDKVEIKVYYETLCRASAQFFVSQLEPAVKNLSSHLDLHLVPYGHAKTYSYSRGFYTFSCQHGPGECYGNMVHACAIDVLRNNTRAVIFNTCLLRYIIYNSTYYDFVHILRWCSYKHKVPLFKIWNCMRGNRGRFLLKQHGEETHRLNLSYVPYMLVDGSSSYQDQAELNLSSTICQLLSPKPRACINTSINLTMN